MNPVVREWIKKAEGDYKASMKLASEDDADVFDAICFHAQQCAEKYLKAFCVDNEIRFPRTHNLEELLKIALRQHTEFEFIRNELEFLNRFSVRVRYPGDFASKEETDQSVRATKVVRKFIREKLGPASGGTKPRAKKRR